MHIIYTSLGWLNIPWSLSSSYIQCKISWGSAIWRKSLASKSMVGVSWLKRGIWHSKTNPKTLKVPWFSFQFWPMVSLWTISEAYLFVFGLGFIPFRFQVRSPLASENHLALSLHRECLTVLTPWQPVEKHTEGVTHPLGCPKWKLGSMVSKWIILYLLINGIYFWGCNPWILTFHSNFLGHPSIFFFGNQPKGWNHRTMMSSWWTLVVIYH